MTLLLTWILVAWGVGLSLQTTRSTFVADLGEDDWRPRRDGTSG